VSIIYFQKWLAFWFLLFCLDLPQVNRSFRGMLSEAAPFSTATDLHLASARHLCSLLPQVGAELSKHTMSVKGRLHFFISLPQPSQLDSLLNSAEV